MDNDRPLTEEAAHAFHVNAVRAMKVAERQYQQRAGEVEAAQRRMHEAKDRVNETTAEEKRTREVWHEAIARDLAI